MNNLPWLAAAALLAAAVVWCFALRRAHHVRRRATTIRARPVAPVRFTQHARERMTLRGVAEHEILAAVANPDRFTRDRTENSVRLEAEHGDRVLKVWVAEPWPSSAETVVKSAAWQYRTTITIDPESVGRLIGTKGRTVQALRQVTGAYIRVDGPTVTITAGERVAMEYALKRVTAIATPCGRVAGCRTSSPGQSLRSLPEPS